MSDNAENIFKNDEEIIRSEAVAYFDDSSNDFRFPVDLFKKYKKQLENFYDPEHKAIYLDEIGKQLEYYLTKHRVECHGGAKDPHCADEIGNEKMQFYRQEMLSYPIIVQQKFTEVSGFVRGSVFISYSHEDKEYLAQIKKHLKSMKTEIWDDTKILPGIEWKAEIENALKKAKVAVLLLSVDFLSSDFITDKEVPHLLEAAAKEGVVILTVILRPCAFSETEISKYQAMNDPNKTIAEMSDVEADRIYLNLVQQVKRHLPK
jgi:hypothetical protein